MNKMKKAQISQWIGWVVLILIAAVLIIAWIWVSLGKGGESVMAIFRLK